LAGEVNRPDRGPATGANAVRTGRGLCAVLWTIAGENEEPKGLLLGSEGTVSALRGEREIMRDAKGTEKDETEGVRGGFEGD